MPPYPFAQLPSYSNFKQKLEQEHGCHFSEAGELRSPDGESRSITYIERVVDGKGLTYVLDVEREGIDISWHLVRSICARLKIDPASFGLDLEKPYL